MSDEYTDVIKCPEGFCGMIWAGQEELEAHLRWDHGRSEYQAEKIANRAVNTDTNQSGDDDD